MTATDLADDLLRGARAIAGYTGLPTRTVYYLHARGVLPTFELPGMAGIFGRKTTLRRWIEALERGEAGGGSPDVAP